MFALRVPSELLRQAEACMFSTDSRGQIAYGPLWRKGRSHPCTLRRMCTCQTEALLCPHPWWALLCELVPSGKCFSFSASALMDKLGPALVASGVAPAELPTWTSHCFRRGSGIDVLEASGVKEMLRHGDWSSARAAEPYATADEQFAVSMASAAQAPDMSDEDT